MKKKKKKKQEKSNTTTLRASVLKGKVNDEAKREREQAKDTSRNAISQLTKRMANQKKEQPLRRHCHRRGESLSSFPFQKGRGRGREGRREGNQ